MSGVNPLSGTTLSSHSVLTLYRVSDTTASINQFCRCAGPVKVGHLLTAVQGPSQLFFKLPYPFLRLLEVPQVLPGFRVIIPKVAVVPAQVQSQRFAVPPDDSVRALDGFYPNVLTVCQPLSGQRFGVQVSPVASNRQYSATPKRAYSSRLKPVSLA